ncbi:MAG: hypothetical protein KDA65_04250, partial [Planctomycetaceae bacterium]|nr:hypothetical protein [Planctomycetaceae bacterium]
SPSIPDHYLKEIISPNGATAVENVYDSNGLLTEVLDADDNSVEIDYINRSSFTTLEQEQLPTATRKEILTDQLGEYWTTYYDDRGNMIAEVDPLQGMTIWEYSDYVTMYYSYVGNEVLHELEGINLLVKETKMIGALDGLIGTPTNDPPDLVTTYDYWMNYNNMFGDGVIEEAAETVTTMVVTTTDPRGNETKRYMNKFGRVFQEIDSLGNKIRINYEQKLDWQEYQSGNPLIVVDPYGKFTEMQYDDRGNISKVRTELGNYSYFSYNAYSELTSAIDQLNNLIVFEYDAYGNQTTISSSWTNPDDPQDVVEFESTTTYDYNGRVTGMTDELGNTTSITYNDEGQTLTDTDIYGRTVTYRYDKKGLVVQTIYDDGMTSESVYDVKGRVTFSTSVHRPGQPANGTQYVYDELDRATTTKQITDMVITVSEIGTTGLYDSTVTTAGTVQETYTSVYDNVSGWLTSSTDSNGNTTNYTYDDYGNQIEVALTIGLTTLTTTYEYDSYGRQTKMIDPYGRDTYYVYDSYGRQIKTIHHTNAESTKTYDDHGRVVSMSSFTGAVTDIEYDSFGRMSAMDVTADGVTSRTEYEYNSNGQISLVRDALGHETLNSYDAYGRQVSFTQVIGEIDDATNMETDDLTYYTTYDVHGNVLTETNALGLTRTFSYDSEGRLSTVTLPQVPDPQNGNTLTAPVYEYNYDVYGNMTKITDPLGRETDLVYNVDNLLLTRTLPVSGTEEFAFDEENRLTRSTDFEGNVIDSVFTDENLIDELHYFNPSADPDVDTPDETVSYTYDDLYRKSSMTNDRGTTYYTYNNDSQITKIDSPEGIINYEYDPLTGQRTRTTTGDPSDVINDFHYTYDSLGRLMTIEMHERNDSVLSTPELTTYSYDAVGNLVRVDQANGVITTYEYDDLYRLDLLTHYYGDSTPSDLSDNQKIAVFDYTLRADGRRTGVTETRWEDESQPTVSITETFTWSYDNLNRLIQETYDSVDNSLDYTADYTYDLVGNRLEKELDYVADNDRDELITYTYNDSDQLLTETKVVGNVDDGINLETDDRVTTYSYTNTLRTGKLVEDSSGNDLANTTYSFNLQGRMDEVVTDTYDSNGDVIRRETATYEYDDMGIRVEATNKVEVDHDSNPSTALQVDSEETTTYLNDPMNHTGFSQVIEEVTYDQLAEAEVDRSIYIFGHDILSQFRINSVNPTGASFFFQYDGHGSTRMLTNLLGEVAAYNSISQIFTYDAYGEALGFIPVDMATNFQHTGEQFDPRIQQVYLRARYYDFTTGTFNRLDPFFGNIADPQSLHKYLYTHGDPVNGIDPSGMNTLLELVLVTGGMAITFIVPGTSDWIADSFKALYKAYNVNLRWDIEWAEDFSMPDSWGSRSDNHWVIVAILSGFYESFKISIPFTTISINPLDIFADIVDGIEPNAMTASRVFPKGRKNPHAPGTYPFHLNGYANYSTSVRLPHTNRHGNEVKSTVDYYYHPKLGQYHVIRFPKSAVRKQYDIRATSPQRTFGLSWSKLTKDQKKVISRSDMRKANDELRKDGLPPGWRIDREHVIIHGVTHVWHHDAKKGRLQLISKELHDAAQGKGFDTGTGPGNHVGLALWHN